ncbi:transposase [Streptomyces sp. MBT65]|uniref:transposase n=1 Tax=Streptomyces sp. MBT65 TaxID=1488395 RepID=UPI0035B04127
MRHPEQLTDGERQQVVALPAHCPELKALHEHVRGFAEILQTRSGQHLKGWIIAVRTEDPPRLHAFATGLEKDRDAVLKGLGTCWNSGPVEGRVNHIILRMTRKPSCPIREAMRKRACYGRHLAARQTQRVGLCCIGAFLAITRPFPPAPRP